MDYNRMRMLELEDAGPAGWKCSNHEPLIFSFPPEVILEKFQWRQPSSQFF